MTQVITHNEVEGFHRWDNAPPQADYLQNLHRHIFHIECRFEVDALDREIELIQAQQEIAAYIRDTYGDPAMFGGMSCEQIAEQLVHRFECNSCEVREDGYGGAEVTR